MFKSVFVFLTVLLISGCVTKTVIPQQETPFTGDVEVAIKNQLLIGFDPSVDDAFFLKAWRLLRPEIVVLGPRKHGSMQLTYSADFSVNDVINIVSATKGVEHAQANYRFFNDKGQSPESLNNK